MRGLNPAFVDVRGQVKNRILYVAPGRVAEQVVAINVEKRSNRL